MVEVKEIEDTEKRSFFSILAPRVVKVELTLKEVKKEEKEHKERKFVEASKEDVNKAKENINKFLEELISKLPEKATYNIQEEKDTLTVTIDGENIGFLIGYRGETLYALQNIISSIANKNTENKVRVLIDIAGYKEKRVKTLEDLAEKIAKTVEKTHKSVTLEPMQAYERKIIHSKLQDNPKVTTKSIGEEPRRKVVISLNR
jgi:spoIIIJ-associated protein